MKAKKVLPIVGVAVVLLATVSGFAFFYPDIMRYLQMKSM
jgi:hypothetical protein